ncbi:MAG: Glucokinase [Deltaproteobacteria bacterium]|nr:Glucokinase [Deltaproteobacteria bacterium]
MKNIIAVDIGGTNSRFAHFRVEDAGELSYVSGFWLKTHSASSLGDLIEKARETGSFARDMSWDAMVLAVPGPVKGKTYATLANVPWTVDVSGLRDRAPDTRIFLINDFVAQAFACPIKEHLETRTIRAGNAENGANIAIIGAGTGLGHCALALTDGATFLPLPSEAGHAAFPFYGKTETDYCDYLLDRTAAEYPFGDIVVSGPGLAHLHSFLTGRLLTPPEVVAEINPDSQTTVLFARFYARAARNYALAVLALGGLHIAGGVAMKNPFLVANEHFIREFSDSPHFGPILENIPITLILSEDSGLWGAAHYGAIKLKTE